MVHVQFLVILLLTSADKSQAATYCQCLFANGSHCCMYSDPEIGDLDCTSVCYKAHRADGVVDPHDPENPGTPCNANGAYETASYWNAYWRDACYKPSSMLAVPEPLTYKTGPGLKPGPAVEPGPKAKPGPKGGI